MQRREYVEQTHRLRQRRAHWRMQVLNIRQSPQLWFRQKLQLQSERREPCHDVIEHVSLLPQILLAPAQHCRERRILTRARAPADRSRQRLRLQHALTHPHQTFRTRPDKTLPATIRERERITVGKPLPQPVQHPQWMQRLIRLQIQRPRQYDFFEFPVADSLQRPRHHRAIITGLRFRETGGRLLPTLHPIGLTIPEALKLRMGPPHPVRQRREIHLRSDQ